MTTRVIGADTFTLLYDGSLRMVAVQKNGATIAEFAYDGDGQMVTASVGGVVTSYVGGYFEWQTDASGSAAVKYYSAGSARTSSPQRIAMRQGGVVTYLFGDHLGSTSAAYDDSADSVRRKGYTAFGQERYSMNGEMPTRYQYTGQRGFEEIGLQYYGARWYDSFLGRFITADSVVPDKGNPRGLDRYAYSSNNPVNYNDPTGHWPEWFDWLQGAAYQYANDMTLGTVDQVAYALGVCMDCNVSEAYQQGQQAGRGAAIVQASAEEVAGAATLGAALAGVGPTGGVSLAAAPVTGGTSLVVGGVTVAGEVVVAAGGAVVAVHGVAVTAFTANNPLSGNYDPIQDLFDDPNQLLGKAPEDIREITHWANNNGWKTETLGRGGHQGQGFILREYNANGQLTGRIIQWHPGGGHHGPEPYWKLSSPTGGTIRIGTQFLER